MTDIIKNFRKFRDAEVSIEDSYYVEERAEPGILTFVLVIGVLADLATIALAIRDLLKERKDIMRFKLETKSLKLTIKGDMSDETILELVKEGTKKVEEEG